MDEDEHLTRVQELYYDCAKIVDDNKAWSAWKIQERLNKFFRDEIDKTL